MVAQLFVPFTETLLVAGCQLMGVARLSAHSKMALTALVGQQKVVDPGEELT